MPSLHSTPSSKSTSLAAVPVEDNGLTVSRWNIRVPPGKSSAKTRGHPTASPRRGTEKARAANATNIYRLFGNESTHLWGAVTVDRRRNGDGTARDSNPSLPACRRVLAGLVRSSESDETGPPRLAWRSPLSYQPHHRSEYTRQGDRCQARKRRDTRRHPGSTNTASPSLVASIPA